jgi:hypothetical protein
MKYLLRTIVMMARHGETAASIKEVCERIYSNETSMILRRDLAEHHRAPPPKIAVTLRGLQPQDFPLIIRERPRRLPMLFARIPSCYVAVTETGELAFMLWVIFNAEWARFGPYFKGRIHRPLQSDECLFEFAYTFEKFRGKGVMGAALVMIAEQVVRERPAVRWAYNYIRQGNLASLKGCRNAGFRPYMKREEHWRGMHLRQSFVRFDPGTRFPFEEVSQRSAIASLPGAHESVRPIASVENWTLAGGDATHKGGG